MFYPEIHGIIFVIDSTDVKRIMVCKDLISEVDKDLNRAIPIVFYVNKQDVENSLKLHDIKDILEIDKADSNFIWKIVRGVAYTGKGTSEAIKFIREQISP